MDIQISPKTTIYPPNLSRNCTFISLIILLWKFFLHVYQCSPIVSAKKKRKTYKNLLVLNVIKTTFCLCPCVLQKQYNIKKKKLRQLKWKRQKKNKLKKKKLLFQQQYFDNYNKLLVKAFFFSDQMTDDKLSVMLCLFLQ